MRKFYVAYYSYGEIVWTTVELNHGEKANVVTFESKIEEMYNYYNEEPDKTFNKISKVAQQLGEDGYSPINSKTLKNFIKSWSSDKELSTTESFIMKAFLSLISEFE